MKTKKILFLSIALVSLVLSGCKTIDPPSGGTDSSLISSSEPSSSQPSSSSQPISGNPNPENPAAIVTTVQALANKKATDTANIYRVTGTAQYPGYYSAGYFDLVDDGWTIVAYGISSKNTCITKSGNKYSYTNDKSFGATGIRAGDIITIEGLFQFYAYSSSYGVPEISGYPTKIISNGLSNITAKSYTAPESYNGTYYNSISSTDKGNALGLKLHNLMMDTHKTYVSYGSLDNTLKSTDSKCFYSGKTSSSYNKEHVWPQSKSNKVFTTSYAGADIHHLRFSISTYNSYRGSTIFAPMFGTPRMIDYAGGGKVKFGSGNTYGVTEPADSMKGDAARIIMYVFIHYGTDFGGTTKDGVTGKLYISNVIGANTVADCFKLLRKWNAEDPVSAEEISRNNIADNKQGNRNPFIDHPSYADLIWG